MSEGKEHVASAILRARADMEEAFWELEKARAQVDHESLADGIPPARFAILSAEISARA
jgi:hypothetical protein